MNSKFDLTFQSNIADLQLNDFNLRQKERKLTHILKQLQ